MNTYTTKNILDVGDTKIHSAHFSIFTDSTWKQVRKHAIAILCEMDNNTAMYGPVLTLTPSARVHGENLTKDDRLSLKAWATCFPRITWAS